MRHKFSVFCFTAALIFSCQAVVSKEMSASVDDPWSRIMKRLQEREAARKGNSSSGRREDLLKRAQNEYANGNINVAIANVQSAIDAGNRTAESYVLLGRCLKTQKRYAEAANAFDQALKLRPADSEIHLQRTSALLSLEKYDLVKDEIDWLMSHQPSSKAYFARATFYFHTGDYEKAIEDLGTVMQKDPRSPDPYRLRAMCYERMGRTNDQQADLAKAQSLQR